MTLRDRVLAVLTAGLWGGNFVAIDIGLRYFPPILFAGLRYLLIAVPTILLISRPNSGGLRWLIGYGVCFGGFQFVLLFFALNAGMPTGLSSLVLQAAAPMTVLLAVVLLHERFDLYRLSGLSLAVLGIAAIAAGQIPVATPGPIILTLGAALAWAVANICLRQAHPPRPMQFILWSSVVPPVPLLALSLSFEGVDATERAVTSSATLSGLPGLIALLVVTFFGTVVGMSIWTSLLARNPAATVAPYSMLVPVVGIVAAALVLSEKPGWIDVPGGIAVLGGVALTSRRRNAGAARADAYKPAVVPARDGGTP